MSPRWRIVLNFCLTRMCIYIYCSGTYCLYLCAAPYLLTQLYPLMRLAGDIQEISCSSLICSCQNGVVLHKWQNLHLPRIDSSPPAWVLLGGTLTNQGYFFFLHFDIFPLFVRLVSSNYRLSSQRYYFSGNAALTWITDVRVRNEKSYTNNNSSYRLSF